MNTLELRDHRISDLYDKTATFFGSVGKGNPLLGYYTRENTRTDRTAAVAALHDTIADALDIHPGNVVLDAGCGGGELASAISQRENARVIGITLSRAQAKLATERFGSDQCAFTVMNFENLGFPDGSVNRIVAKESLLHAAEKDNFLRQAHRVLSTDGKLVIADLTLQHDPSGKEWVPLAAFQNEFHVAPLISTAHYVSLLENAGFSEISLQDITAEVSRSFTDYIGETLVTRVSQSIEQSPFQNIATRWILGSHAMKSLFRENIAGYHIISAHK